jgi:hypothetical protein
VTEAESKPIAPSPRVGRLTSVKGVRKELARLYTDARQGNGVTPSNGAKLAYMLTCCQKVLELEAIEGRLGELEKRLQEGRRG